MLGAETHDAEVRADLGAETHDAEVRADLGAETHDAEVREDLGAARLADRWDQARPACFATSAAKSSFFFSRPSPSSKRTKRRILMFSPIFAISACWS